MNIQTSLYFSTFTNLNWLHLLEDNFHKQIILKSLKFLVEDKRITLYGFVIMPNHIHLLWQIEKEHELKNVQRDFLKYTAQQIKFNLIDTGNKILADLVVYSKDRKAQIWERNGLSFMLNNPETIKQKLNYIHNNPIKEKWSLAEVPEKYHYSSAAFYATGNDTFEMLTHLSEVLN
ncbi:MAG: transposase [Bacteroidota bacterium]|nr:transposase [Bacteroidota bacterium]